MQVEKNPILLQSNYGREGLQMLSHLLDGNYWLLRVKVSDRQSIICFPKFETVGIGFFDEQEPDINLPYTVPAERIYQHIECNKGDDAISDEVCIAAITELQKQISKIFVTE